MCRAPVIGAGDVGIKPTTGLVSRTGIVPIAASQDTAGPIVKSVADAAALLTAICGTDPMDALTAGNPLAGHDFTTDLNKNALQGARIDALMSASNLTALLFANSGSAGIGAKADYPSISVPAGYQASNRRPFNIAFLGQAWSEPTLIGYAHAYEQATLLHQPPSAINPTLFG